MNKALRTWQLVGKSLREHVAVMILYVLQSDGSSPGRQGFFMAVNAVGETEGSIGGGIMEYKFVEMAKEMLREKTTDLVLKKQFHNKSAPANQSGMICSGEQTILLYELSSRDPIEEIISSLEQYNNGTLTLSPQGLQFTNDIPAADYFFSMATENDWLYREKTGYKHHLHIVGAGHCSLALSQFMRAMDFFIHVYDDRPDVQTLLQNEYAHQKHVLTDYSALEIPSGNNQYVVIMTVGYRTDDIAIRALWNKQFRYFGVLGSQTKINKLFAGYRAAGVPETILQKIHAPIGLPIHSQTPEEIAVSIAAEIIKVKNQH